VLSLSAPIGPSSLATAISYPTQYMDHCGQTGSPRDACSGWSIGQLSTWGDWAGPALNTSPSGNLLQGYPPFYYADPKPGFAGTRGWGPNQNPGTYYLSLGVSSGGYAFEMPGAQQGDGSIDTGRYARDIPGDYVFSQLGTPLPLTFIELRTTNYSYQLCTPSGNMWCSSGQQPAAKRRSPK
jgi:hypothetical protein